MRTRRLHARLAYVMRVGYRASVAYERRGFRAYVAGSARNKHLGSVQLYMKITENSANESELAVQFKTLAIEIFKTLSLPHSPAFARGPNG
jgi:hypothetical protein